MGDDTDDFRCRTDWANNAHMHRAQARPPAGRRGAHRTFRRTLHLGPTTERGPFDLPPTRLVPPGTCNCSCTLWVYAASDEMAGRPDQRAGERAWTTDWRRSNWTTPPPLPLLSSPPPLACMTRTHPPSHTSLLPLLLREERDRQSPVRPAFWGEGPPFGGLW